MDALIKFFFGIAAVFVIPIIITSGVMIHKVVTYESNIVYDAEGRITHEFNGWDATESERKALLILLASAIGSVSIAAVMVYVKEKQNKKIK